MSENINGGESHRLKEQLERFKDAQFNEFKKDIGDRLSDHEGRIRSLEGTTPTLEFCRTVETRTTEGMADVHEEIGELRDKVQQMVGGRGLVAFLIPILALLLAVASFLLTVLRK